MIWLIGNKGMLGSEIEAQLQKNGMDYVASDRDVDITDESALDAFANGKNIGWIINCSAYTAVDKAESDTNLCEQINATGPLNIAKIAKKTGAKLIHFSTDYVFDGNAQTPYRPEDTPNPQSVYGSTKLKGEENIRSVFNRFFVIRIAWLYGKYGPNFVKTMLRLFAERDELKVVSDQFGAPTYALILAKNVVNMIQRNNETFGVYHYTDAGKISWYDFAKEIYRIARMTDKIKKDVTIKPVPTSEYPTPAKRPAFSLLDCHKTVEKLGFEQVDWKDNLMYYLKSDV